MRKRPFLISASFKNAARFFRKFRPCHHFRHRKSFFVSRCDDLQFTCLRINGNLRKAVCFPDRPFLIFLIFRFKNIRCPLVDENISFEQYFKENQFELTDLDEMELEQLLVDCINIGTGSNLVRVVTLGEVQRELLSLISGLSSYPLQFMHNVAFTDFTILGLISTRFGDHTAETIDTKHLIINDFTVRHVHTEVNVKFNLPAEVIDPAIELTAETGSLYYYDPMVDVVENYGHVGTYHFDTRAIGVRGYSLVFDEAPIEDGQMDQYVNSTDPDWP